jgi:hypothetical protein
VTPTSTRLRAITPHFSLGPKAANGEAMPKNPEIRRRFAFMLFVMRDRLQR